LAETVGGYNDTRTVFGPADGNRRSIAHEPAQHFATRLDFSNQDGLRAAWNPFLSASDPESNADRYSALSITSLFALRIGLSYVGAGYVAAGFGELRRVVM